jgi:hypothetical protein
MTWMAMAITLRKLRNGRALILPHNICKRENVPSKDSFIRKSDEPLYHSGMDGAKLGKSWQARIVPNSEENISLRLRFQHKC